ncbi:MAG: hypothetical protein ACXWC7_20700, partial [Chitinophagaceae bacterium]
MRTLSCLFMVVFVLAACDNVEIGYARDVDPETIYYDYKIWAEEGKDDATVMLQYRFAGKDGTTLVIEEPSKVTFDGEELKMDSAGFTGVYYEKIRPLKDFSGKHTIVFTDKNKKEHKEEFSFEPFTLAAEFPEKVKKEPFTIKLSNFPAEPANVRLVMMDTAVHSKSVNEEMTIKNGEIRIDSGMLNGLTKGPIVFEIYIEDEKPLKNASKEG